MQKVLLVEDDDLCRELLQTCLRKAGIDVVATSDTPTALHELLINNYTALLTDYDLKDGQDGAWLIRKARSFHQSQRLSIYMYSSSKRALALSKSLQFKAYSKLKLCPSELVKRLAQDLAGCSRAHNCFRSYPMIDKNNENSYACRNFHTEPAAQNSRLFLDINFK